MIRLHRARSAALMATFLGFCPGPARAVERACPGPRIEPDPAFGARFPEMFERIQREVAGRADLDACARVALGLDAETVTVSVILPDGRAASRSVTRPEDVVPTLQALLLVPERPASARTAAAPALTPAPARPPAPARRLTRRTIRHIDEASYAERDAPNSEAARRAWGVELSLISGVRVGDGQIGYGAGALSFLEVYGWLVGFEGRADGYRALVGGDPETALELAVLTGKRFDLGSVALDLTAGPAVAMKGLAFSQTQVVRMSDSGSPPPPPPAALAEDPSTGPVPRLLLGARFGFFPRSAFRTFVGIDGEVGPTRVEDDASPRATRLPGFSVGLAFGATVGTP